MRNAAKTVAVWLARLAGVLFLAAAFAWLALDVRPDGHVELSTALGVAVFAMIGGWLISKRKTLELLQFLRVQLAKFFTLPGGTPPAGGAS